jgi:hypothetical protein
MFMNQKFVALIKAPKKVKDTGVNMKLNKIGILATITVTISLFGSGCSLLSKNAQGPVQNSATGPTISTSVPSMAGVVARIQKGLPNVSPASGNFQKVLAQVQTNLPSVTDPTKATGLDQIPVLIYGACSDISTALMNSVYKVNSSTSVATNMAPLVAAGVTMVNLHVGNLAAAGTPLNAQVSAVFTTLVNADIGSGATTAQAFNSVCMAANSFGVGMTGF